MKKVLFVCIHNSIRSQMAEGLARHYGRGLLKVYSAGLHKTGVNPLAIQIMNEIGVDIESQRSKTIDKLRNINFDYLISLCTETEDSYCPILPGAKRLHWPTPDPGKVKGTREEILIAFRNTRDELRQKILGLIKKLEN